MWQAKRYGPRLHIAKRSKRHKFGKQQTQPRAIAASTANNKLELQKFGRYAEKIAFKEQPPAFVQT